MKSYFDSMLRLTHWFSSIERTNLLEFVMHVAVIYF